MDAPEPGAPVDLRRNEFFRSSRFADQCAVRRHRNAMDAPPGCADLPLLCGGALALAGNDKIAARRCLAANPDRLWRDGPIVRGGPAAPAACICAFFIF